MYVRATCSCRSNTLYVRGKSCFSLHCFYDVALRTKTFDAPYMPKHYVRKELVESLHESVYNILL